MKWSYWKVAVKSKESSGTRWRIWATFANVADAEQFCDKTKKENPSWQLRVVHPDQKLNPKSSVPLQYSPTANPAVRP